MEWRFFQIMLRPLSGSLLSDDFWYGGPVSCPSDAGAFASLTIGMQAASNATRKKRGTAAPPLRVLHLVLLPVEQVAAVSARPQASV